MLGTTGEALQMTMPTTIREPFHQVQCKADIDDANLCSNKDGSYYYSNSNGSKCTLANRIWICVRLPTENYFLQTIAVLQERRATQAPQEEVGLSPREATGFPSRNSMR